MTKNIERVGMPQEPVDQIGRLQRGLSRIPQGAAEGMKRLQEVLGERPSEDDAFMEPEERLPVEVTNLDAENLTTPISEDEPNEESIEVDSEETPDSPLVERVRAIETAPAVSTQDIRQTATLASAERHKHEIVPILNSKGEPKAYKVLSPSGKQEFIVSRENMEMKILHDTIIGNEADQQEVLSIFDLVTKVKGAMQALGVPDISTDPVQIAEKARLLIEKATEIQKARTEFEMENATQAFLRLYVRVMSGDKRDYNNLNSDQKEQMKTFGDILMVHMLQKMGISNEDLAVAETIKEVDKNLRERKATALLMDWHTGGNAAGGAVGGFIGGLLGKGTENIVTPVTKAVFGDEKAKGGLVGAVKDTAGEVVEGVVDKAGEKIDNTVEWVKEKRNG